MVLLRNCNIWRRLEHFPSYQAQNSKEIRKIAILVSEKLKHEVKPVHWARCQVAGHVFSPKTAFQNVKNLKKSNNLAGSLLFLRNHHVLHFKRWWVNGLSYEKSDAIFEILRKFPFRYITKIFFPSLTGMFKLTSKIFEKSWFFCCSIVPPIYINRKMILHSFSATIGLLLPNEKRYEHAVFAKILEN